ncbi:MAG: hypothetical protein P1U54_02685 [Immundisolibacteraceae bacterium]|nr:hypothetical protein [Immundisolibacteraceae bacterium]
MIDAQNIFEKMEEFFPDVKAFQVPFFEAYDLAAPAGKKICLANTIYECVGKNAWNNLPEAPPEKKIEKAKLTEILNGAKTFFFTGDLDFSEEMYEAITKPAGRILGRRSSHGSLSHGHLASKTELSNAQAELSLNLALSFAAYFFRILEESDNRLNYDEYSEENGFNEWLNRKGERVGGASYSWLLYQHDYTAYEDYFDNYQELTSN